MGGGGKGGTSVSSVQIPPEVLARYNAVNERAETVAQRPYQAYSTDPNAFVAPLTQTQQAGIQNTNAMAGAAQPYFSAATEQLLAAQQGAQPSLNYAYQNLGQAQDVGQALGAQAAQYYGQAQGAAQPYYGAATQGTQAAIQGAQPYQRAATQGTQAALQAGQAYQPAATMAALMGGQAINPQGLDVQQYMSPYTQNVVNATQAALGQQFGQQLSQQQADAIKSGAFGGDRSGLQRALLQGQQGLATAQAISPLYQQAYNNALQTAQQQQGVGLGAAQANRAAQAAMGQQLAALGQQGFGQNLSAAQQMGAIGQQGFAQNLGAAQQMQGLGKDIYGQNIGTGQAIQGLGQQQFGQGTGIAQALAALGQQGYGMGAGTSQALAALGTGAQQAGLAGAQAQLGAGATEQQTKQAGLQALYNQFMQQQGYPFQIAQFLANIAEGTGALSGNTTTTVMPSDRRLKENIQKIGETNDNQPIYRYNFKGDPRTQIGLMAQDVEKHHPEAVDDSHGYKSVDYRKATEDAIHKDDGGEVAGLGRYSMAAPSAFLQKPAGLGALTLPQMKTGSDIAIQPGVNAAEISAMRAPTATGLSPGSLESAKAQYASLSSITPQSGQDYADYKMKQLKDFLAKYGETPPESTGVSSRGGLVPSGGGEGFASGGYADGGYPGYINPALQYYGPQGTKGPFDAAGPYGAALAQAQARQLLQGTKPPTDNRPTGLQQAKTIGDLGVMASDAWKARPNFLRTSADAASRDLADKISAAEIARKAKELGINTDVPAEAHGGFIEHRDHYANLGYVSPSSGPYGTDDQNALGAILTAPQQHYELLKPNERRQMPQQEGALGDALKVASLGKTAFDVGKMGKGAADWVGAKLAGEGAAKGAMPEVIDLTTKAPGLGSAAVETAGGLGKAAAETGAAAVPEVAAAVPEAVVAAAPEAATAVPELVASAQVPEWLMGLGFFLNRGGAVPRRHFAGDEGSYVTPERSGRLTGPDVGEPMTDEDRAALKALALQTIVQKAAQEKGVAPAPSPDAAPPAEIPVKPAGRAAVGELSASRAPFKYFASDLMSDKLSPGTKAALSSENLWVPLLSGIGATMASRAPTRGQAIGEGLVGATTAYTGLQKQQSGTDLERALERLNLQRAGQQSIIYNSKTGLPTGVLVSTPTGMQQMDFGEAWEKRHSLNLLPSTLSEMETEVRRHPEIVSRGTPGGGTLAGTAGKQTPTPIQPQPQRATPEQSSVPTETAKKTETQAPAAEPEKKGMRPIEQIFSVDAPTEARIGEEVKKRIGTDTSAVRDEFAVKAQRAQESREQKPLLMELGAAFSGLPAESIMASGSGAPVATTLGGWANWLAGAVGASPVVNPEDIARAEKIQKVTAQMNKAATETSGQKSYSAYDAMGKMFPTMATSREGTAENFANIVVTNQMPDDENRFGQDWFNKAKKINSAYAITTGPAVSEAFKDKFAPVYEQEKKAIKSMFLDPVVKKGGEPVLDPKTGRPMNYFQYISEQGKNFSPEIKKAIESRYGEGILRYFPNVAR